MKAAYLMQYREAIDRAETALRAYDRYDPNASACKALEQGRECAEALRRLLELCPDQ